MIDEDEVAGMAAAVGKPLPRWTWVAGVIALVLTVVGTWLVVGVLHVGRDSAAAGTVYHSEIDSGTYPTKATVAVAGETIPVQVTKPADRLPNDVARYDADGPQLAPDGGTWVGVQWNTNFSAATSYVANVLGPLHRRPAFSLRADGHTYPLTTPQESQVYCGTLCSARGSVWVALPGHGKGLAVLVTFDGVTQTVDGATGAIDKGRAAPLYTAVEAASRPCGRAALSGGFSLRYSGDCTLMSARSPWASGLGWAPSGQTWVVVVVNVPDRVAVRNGGTEYTSPHDAATVRYDTSGLQLVRRIAVAPGELAADAGLPSVTLVYRAAAGATGRMVITGRYPLSPDGDIPLTARTAAVTATWKVIL